MAFKMKGSPIKLGKIQGTAGHASALKQVEISPLKHKEDQRHYHGPAYLPESYKGTNPRAEFKKWKEENPKGNKMEWINNWKNKTNDPTMPSAQQAAEIIPEWGSKYGAEGASLNELWDLAVPSSGGSHHSRIISMESGEGAAIPGTGGKDGFDERSPEQIEFDNLKYENIVNNPGTSLEDQGIISPGRKKAMEEDELLKKQHEERQTQEIVPLETQNVSTELLTSDVAPPELAKMKGHKHFEKHGYYPIQDPERHRKHLISKYGRKTGKEKFKTFAKKNKINI